MRERAEKEQKERGLSVKRKMSQEPKEIEKGKGFGQRREEKREE